MTLQERLKQTITDTYTNTLNFKGRTSRADYWLFIAYYAVVSLFMYLLTLLAIAEDIGEGIYSIYLFVHFFVMLSLQARRLHDTNKSAWWLLIAFVPVVGMIVLFIFYVLPGDHGDNRYGKDPQAFEHAPGQEVL